MVLIGSTLQSRQFRGRGTACCVLAASEVYQGWLTVLCRQERVQFDLFRRFTEFLPKSGRTVRV